MQTVKDLAASLVQVALLGYAAKSAYEIRMHAIRTYGLVIHEFDPWFNFRATQYLADNGLERFFKWYDYMSWYPLGRPVGTTIYPGMQMVSVFIWKVLNASGVEMSLNDVCCYVPVWFGVLATILLGLMTYVVSGSKNAGVFASLIMAIVPAHLMRSIGGGFDNESVAVSCLCLTFLMWVYSLYGKNKDDDKMTWKGILVGLAYVCMVASWGGFVFVLNMIGIHAFVLILLGRFTNKLYWSYTLWYIVGTFGATRVPVVGLTPLKSLEQLAPAGVFVLMQLLKLCDSDFLLKYFKIERGSITTTQRIKVYTQVFGLAALLGSVAAYQLWNMGYFGPLSSRVRGLFVQHTRTGNPLVDSVAEHQPAKPENFFQFLHYVCYIAPVGFVIAVYSAVLRPLVLGRKPKETNTDPLLFLVMYACVTYFFALKMNRLMLLMAPVSSALGGIALSSFLDFFLAEVVAVLAVFFPSLAAAKESSSSSSKKASDEAEKKTETTASASATAGSEKTPSKKNKNKNTSSSSSSSAAASTADKRTIADTICDLLTQLNELSVVQLVRKMVAAMVMYLLISRTPEFIKLCEEMMYGLSNPSLMFQARLNDGTMVMVDDYREAYWWLRDNTPEGINESMSG
jgi:dolichyl-diphosphooligosaccharide---protein glycosyltransferase